MKKDKQKFILRLFLFLVLFLVVLIPLNRYYFHNIIPKTILARTEAQYMELTHEPSYVFMGDSRIKFGLNPEYIDNSFNYGVLGGNYMRSYYLLPHVMETSKTCGLILQYDLNSFASVHLSDLGDEWYWSQYTDFSELRDNGVDINLIESAVLSYIPFIGKGEDYLVDKNRATTLIRGHQVAQKDFSQLTTKKEKAEQQANFHYGGSDLLDSRLVFYFEGLLERASSYGLKVVLVKLPVTDLYLDASAAFIPDLSKFYGEVDKIAATYDNVFILDYQDKYSSDHTLFGDPHHLNVKGAATVSQELAKDLVGVC